MRGLFGRIVAAIGAPAILVTLQFAPRMRTAMVRHIALVEILARKLLLAEAAALTPDMQRGPRFIETKLRASGLYTPPPARRRPCAPQRARITDPANPETWSARFALAIPRDARTVADRRAPRIRALWGGAPPPPAPERSPPNRNSGAFCVARRVEALRRVLNDPAPHVQRLARSRRIGVARSRDVIRHYALRAPRRFVGDRHDPLLTIHIFSAAVRAQTVLADTS
ncbi:MAG: hypothetical protein R3C31_14620 [Hyphomonadaceae bacterium]